MTAIAGWREGRRKATPPDLVDLHTHVIPRVDDGAPSMESALETLRSLYVDGVKSVVATPHLNASDTHGGRRASVDATWPRLLRRTQAAVPQLKLYRGFEIQLDSPNPDLSDPALRLGGSRFALVEFRAFTIPVQSAEALRRIADGGYVPVLAHPERYSGYHTGFEIANEWRAAGALLQVNGGSLLGEYGNGVRLIAQRFLTDGLIDLIASDNHARPGRSPSLRSVWDYLVARGLQEQARLLLSANPGRILKDQMPERVSPAGEGDGFLARLARVFRS